jgi:hypothetical protein
MALDESNDEDAHICLRCIGDSFLREEVRAEGRHGTCSYCRAADIGIRLSDLGDRIHEVLEAQFHLTPSEPDGVDYIFAKEEGYWDRPGDPVTQVIADIAGLDEEIAENI